MHHGRRILLLEDDPEEARRSRTALSENGYAVSLAGSLEAAHQAIRRDGAYDLVIVDHQLPDGEGPGIIPYLRAAGIHAPVVMITGNRSERVAEMAFEAGCVDTAVKDVDYHTWLPRMAEALIEPSTDAENDPRWGPHVQGICAGRVHGTSVRRSPPEFWAPYSLALQSATDLAIRALRAANQSVLGSVPTIHVRMAEGKHLALVMRGGVFAAAVLTRAPDDDDAAELVAEAMAFAKARSSAEQNE